MRINAQTIGISILLALISVSSLDSSSVEDVDRPISRDRETLVSSTPKLQFYRRLAELEVKIQNNLFKEGPIEAGSDIFGHFRLVWNSQEALNKIAKQTLRGKIDNFEKAGALMHSAVQIQLVEYERVNVEIPNEQAAVWEVTADYQLVTRDMIAKWGGLPFTGKAAKPACRRIPETAEIQFSMNEIDYGCRETITSDNSQDQVVLTSSSRDSNREESNDVPSLDKFRRSVTNGKGNQLTGIWVEGILAFRVVSGIGNIAPSARDTASIYDWADKHGVTGLLIHNYLGGTRIYQLNPGVRIAAIYGNGGVDWYISRGGKWYETRTYSSTGIAGPFRNWACTDCKFDLKVRDIRSLHYAGSHRITFQTCVEVGGRFGVMIVEAYYAGEEDTNSTALMRDSKFKMVIEPPGG